MSQNRKQQRDLDVWWAFENGATIGLPGSEAGVIVRDKEHDFGARATLERDCRHAPWCVTCGIYGWFSHTRFLGSEAQAEFPALRAGLAEILDIIRIADDLDAEAKMPAAGDAISDFVARFP